MEKVVPIFNSPLEDFWKIFLPTLIVLICCLSTSWMMTPAMMWITAYLLDGGHVYSTFLEVYLDPKENRKAYVPYVTLIAFFLNLIVLVFVHNYFYTYIFYFTVFHNMRQGLGVTLLYRKGTHIKLFKWAYYFLTMGPFLIFHLLPRAGENHLSERIIKSIEFPLFSLPETAQKVWSMAVYVYIAVAILLLVYLTKNKLRRGVWSLYFYGGVYALGFLYFKNEIYSYSLLIFSHTIPYFFLMETRSKLTHSVNWMRQWAIALIALLFFAGGMLDYYQLAIINYFDDVDLLVQALLLTPLIAHFLFDGIIWKRGNERFHAFTSKKALEHS
jgi:hypothetical protein